MGLEERVHMVRVWMPGELRIGRGMTVGSSGNCGNEQRLLFESLLLIRRCVIPQLTAHFLANYPSLVLSHARVAAFFS